MKNRLEELRKQRGIRQEELAAALETMRSLNEAEVGLKRFEAALWKIDAIQDRTIARATELAEAGEA